jgi:hypothetical protein
VPNFTREYVVQEVARALEFLAPAPERASDEGYDHYRERRSDHDSKARISGRTALAMILGQLRDGLCIDCVVKARLADHRP